MTEQRSATDSLPRPAEGDLLGRWATAAPWRGALLLLVLWGIMFALRIVGPFDIDNQRQDRTAAYILDIVSNGNWVVQYDKNGLVMLKPPLYNWLVAVACMAWDSVSMLPLYLPGALCSLFLALIAWRVAGREYGPLAGLLSGVAFLASWFGSKLTGYVRVDGLFAVLVGLGILELVRCLRGGRPWWLFWLWMTLATLTKGPLALLLALGAIVFQARRLRAEAGTWLPRPISFVAGLVVLAVVNIGWYLAAKHVAGPVLEEQLIKDQLVRHATHDFLESVRGAPGPAFNTFMRTLPWSIAAAAVIAGFLRRWRRNESIASLEATCVGTVLFGITCFTVFPHRSPDHLFPLIPFVAILAGRGVAEAMTGRLAWIRITWLLPVVAVAAVALGLNENADNAKEPTNLERLAAERLAAQVTKALGPTPPVTIVEAPFSFHLALQRRWTEADRDVALAAFASTKLPMYVVVERPARFIEALPPGTPAYLIGEEKAPVKDWSIGVVSNREHVEDPSTALLIVGDSRIELRGAAAIAVPLHRFDTFASFRRARPDGTVTVTTSLAAASHVVLDGVPFDFTTIDSAPAQSFPR